MSIAAQRVEIDDVLADSPGLKPRLTEAIVRAYRRARLDAPRETGLDTDMFAIACPYAWNDVRVRTFEV